MSNVLESIVGTLPAKVQPYAKTYAAALVSGLAVVSTLVDLPVWVTVALAVANAPVIFAVPNLDPNAEKQDESVQPPDPELADPANVILVNGDKPLNPPHDGVYGYGSGV